jgi:hypothetical protein
MKATINELEINSKNKNIRVLYRGINYFKKGYKPRTNIVKDEKCDLVADSDSILTRSRNYLSQLLNVHGDNNVRQNYWCLSLAFLRLRWLLKNLEVQITRY